MNDAIQKRAVLATLRATPDFSQLPLLRRMKPSEQKRLLRWLEISGLAFHFFERLRTGGKLSEIPSEMAESLASKLDANSRRMEDMFAEFRRVNAAFRKRGFRHAFVKGFTLFPDFCADRKLRHQTDIDMLVSPADLDEAGRVLETLGYSRVPSNNPKESRYATPRTSIPSPSEDLFQIQPHREAEIHTSIWETSKRYRVEIAVPADLLDRARTRAYDGIELFALAAEDMFLLQLLHAFQHLLGSWVRLSWLWEIHYFMRCNLNQSALWSSAQACGGEDPLLRHACGLIVRLTNRLFDTPVPPVLQAWCVEPLPQKMRAWVDLLGVKWALVDMRGSKLALFVHGDFIADSATRRRHLLRRLIPVAGRPSLGEVSTHSGWARFALRIARLRFICRRLWVHVSDVPPLCIEFLRWRRAQKEFGAVDDARPAARR
ncbi:MAG TPA: nucleotidyltransferase family protein [Candidatus Acidoferrales bacterium]|nr:nucleotidyltransferase family protein [Candidatus Acidoferrales bacterium]